jgi:hypothetical protein
MDLRIAIVPFTFLLKDLCKEKSLELIFLRFKFVKTGFVGLNDSWFIMKKNGLKRESIIRLRKQF